MKTKCISLLAPANGGTKYTLADPALQFTHKINDRV
jgi:hypothetical protein